MKRTRRQKAAMIVALILAAMLLVPVIITVIGAMIPTAVAKVSQKDIDKRKSDAKVYLSQKADIQNQLKQLKNEKANAVKIKQAIDAQIEIIELEIENNNQLILDLNVHLAEQQAALEAAVIQEQQAEELFRTRLRAMEELGTASYLTILFESGSFADLLDRINTISEIMEADQRVIQYLADARAEIEETKALLEQDKLDQYEISKQLAASQAELAEQYAESDEFIAELNRDALELEKAYKEAEKAEKDAEDEIKKLQAELKKQQEAAKKSTQYVGGEYLWPLPGYDIGSGDGSQFGMRMHPILKYRKMHNGIDIPAPKNTPILAANDGTVLIATKHSSYGNYVTLDHGGGKATLYAHMTKYSVKVGQSVKRGDVIGYVGTTGMSTGNHLHLGCMENGNFVDPMKYFTKVK